jgi:hypothetical protein
MANQTNATPSRGRAGTPPMKPGNEAPHAAAGGRDPAAERDRAAAPECLVDAMVEQTFPASDATQLPGRAEGAPNAAPSRPVGADEPRDAPRTIGNQGVIPASRDLEDSVDLGQASVALRLDRDRRALEVRLTSNGAVLDAAGVDRLIAALSTKRAQMNG